MFDPTNIELMKDKVFQYLGLDRIYKALKEDTVNEIAQNKQYIELLEDQLATSDGLPAEGENALNILKEKHQRLIKTNDVLNQESTSLVLREIAFKSFMEKFEDDRDEMFAHMERTEKSLKLIDEIRNQFGDLFKDI